MEILHARHSGFCFGVKRAIHLAKGAALQGKAYSYGPLIHNPREVACLEKQGVFAIPDLDQLPSGGHVIICAHGVGPAVYAQAKEKGWQLTDATCPFVTKAQNLAKRMMDEGRQVVIVGDHNHPEVKGLLAWAGNRAVAVADVAAAQNLPQFTQPIGILAQTTQQEENFAQVARYLQENYADVAVGSTICQATAKRQYAAAELAQEADMVLVIGGKNSANTKNLAAVCRAQSTPAYLIESPEDLKGIDLRNVNRLGIVAGASTPDWIIQEIEEVVGKMSENSNLEPMEKKENGLDVVPEGASAAPLEQQNAEAAAPSEQQTIEAAAPSEQETIEAAAPSEQQTIAATAPLEQQNAEAATPSEQQTIEAAAPSEQETIEAAAPSEQQTIAATAPLEQQNAEAATPSEQQNAEAATPSEQQNAEAAAPAAPQTGEKAAGKEETMAEISGDASFADVYDKDLREVRRGARVKGIVVQVRNDEVLVDIGGKSEGLLASSELNSMEAADIPGSFKVGDEIEVLILKRENKEGYPLLSKKRVDQDVLWDKLAKAKENGEIVTGKVVEVVKGGLLVDVGIKGFVPASLMSLGYVENLASYMGKEIKAKVIECHKATNKLLLSPKAVLQEEAKQKKEEAWSTLQEGQTRPGVVRRLTNFGAFVDIGGVDGLLHVSEMAWYRLNHPSDLLKEGQEIDVYVLGLDREKEKISLGLKQLIANPWVNVEEKYPVGGEFPAKVMRTAPFGAFVQLEPGMEGLVHISQLAPERVAKTEDVVKAGDMIQVKVLSVDKENKKISLSRKAALPKPEAKTAEGSENTENETPTFAKEELDVTLGDMMDPERVIE